ncbi:MAG TPA: CCA tRNA nucleotidyltransferase [Allosphingosinicella sp.]|jgi:poly(A) polymerase|nr:CCA tRNA nucleotidyltransferase [Allosphingosinicella sp.]
MKLPEAPWQNAEAMPKLLAALGAAEGETRFVGGCVRDTLLGLPVSDVDLATRLLPADVMKRIRGAGLKPIPTGLAHGTVTALIGNRSTVEITTLRRDVATDGRRATIAYTDDWREDAARRDFTINALSADPASLEVHDYFGGLDDLAARRVRFIGDPITRIAEDHLRILRFFRFHARFGSGEPDSEGLAACAARANDLMALSRERIADELLKLLGLPDPASTVALMLAHGILAPVLPEIEQVGSHRLARLPQRESAAGVPADPLRRFGALLPADSEAAAAVGARLRLSNVARQRLVCIAGRGDPAPADPAALAYRVGLPCAIDRLLLSEALSMGDAAAAVRRLEGWQKPKLPVTGGMLIARGLEAGPVVARTIQAIERDWIEAGFPDGAAFETIVDDRLAQALSDSQ